MELDDIIYEAVTADASLVEMTSGNIVTCCFEVPPDIEDNTTLPYIIIIEDPTVNEQGTKDDEWEAEYDSAQVSIEIAASTKQEVKEIRRKIRKAIGEYVNAMEDDRPYLKSYSNEGITWDWLKPCYWDRLHYQCEIFNNLSDDGTE